METTFSTRPAENKPLPDPFRSASCPAPDLARKTPGYEGVQRMDVVPVAPTERFRVDTDYDAIMQEKGRLISIARDLVYRANPEAMAGGREILAEAVENICGLYPQNFTRIGESLLIKSSGRIISLAESEPDPLLALAQIVQEDITLLHRDSAGVYRLAAGCVCFPSHWSLEQKMGMTVQEIHAPVPELNARIGGKIDALLDRLSPERPMARINFLINYNPRLSQMPELESLVPHVPSKLTADNIGEVLWLRNEYETLSKLPKSDDIIFTLKTYQTQLRDVPAETARKLADMHRGLPDRYRDQYRKLNPAEHEMLLDYLERKSA